MEIERFGEGDIKTIEELEEKSDIKLPYDYKNFLIKNNGAKNLNLEKRKYITVFNFIKTETPEFKSVIPENYSRNCPIPSLKN